MATAPRCTRLPDPAPSDTAGRDGFRRGAWSALLGLLVLAFLVCWWIARFRALPQPSMLPGMVPPPIPLLDLAGNRHDLERLRGQRILLLFWASWSPVSVSQLEVVAHLPRPVRPQERWEQVGVVLDASGGDDARDIVEQVRPGFAQLVATRATIEAWGNLPVLPVLCELGADGRIRRCEKGFVSAEQLLAWRRSVP